MYKEHDQFKITKTANKPIWRYMDFWKILSIINTSKLYFPKPERLGDQHEGRIPQKIFEMMKNDDKEQGRTNNSAENYKGALDNLRQKILISSWSAGVNENFAMWKMYAKEKLGVAIKTDIKELRLSFKEATEDIYIGEVNYYNDKKPQYHIGNMFYPFLTKHNYYLFENEVRCISIIKEKNMTYKNIDVDLNHLIKELYVSKFAENVGLVEIIEQLKIKNNLNFKIKISGVNDNWI